MDGILIVDKPQGMTSHDVVDLVRDRFKIKKVGHAGTLDPIATGVLVMLVGKFTKESQRFIADDKEYEATLVLGARSDTGDAWGKVEASGRAVDFRKDEIEEVFGRFRGEIEQVPPMYSAVKVNGQKLYQLARKGRSVKVAPRKIVIKKLEILETNLPYISFRLTCSKGTYVRQLCVDIGEALGCGGHLSILRRTRSGAFNIGKAITVDALKALDAAGLQEKLLSL